MSDSRPGQPRRSVPRRVVPAFLVAAVTLGLLVSLAGGAWAVCGLDPDDPPLTIRQMIRQGATGERHPDTLFLGRVREVRDPGERGGDAIARFSVRAHPVGWAPQRSRVRFWRTPRNTYLEDNFEFRDERRYAVVAERRDDGKFAFDGGCGQTRRLSRVQLVRLLRLARSLGRA